MEHHAYWHIHHDVLLEYTTNIQERIAYIKSDKPEHERETRLRLMGPVKGALPIAVAKAGAAYTTAGDAYDKAVRDNAPAIEALHKIECPNCPWNGYTIFPTIFPKQR